MGVFLEHMLENPRKALALGLVGSAASWVFFSSGPGVVRSLKDPWSVHLWLLDWLTTGMAAVMLLSLFLVYLGLAARQ